MAILAAVAYPYIEQPYEEPQVVDAVVGPRAWRDIAALVLMALGLMGLVACAFVIDPILGFAVLSAVILLTGAALGYDRYSGG